MFLAFFFDHVPTVVGHKNAIYRGCFWYITLPNQGTIHILRHHNFGVFGPPFPPYVSMFLVLRISKNWHFLTPLPPYQC